MKAGGAFAAVIMVIPHRAQTKISTFAGTGFRRNFGKTEVWIADFRWPVSVRVALLSLFVSRALLAGGADRDCELCRPARNRNPGEVAGCGSHGPDSRTD